MIDVYRDFSESFLAASPVVWRKPAHERFAWALETYTIEPMMQDLKSLQAGTSHFLGQNFWKAFDVQFTNEQNEQEYVRWTSWWVSTRLMWNLIMAHSDDQWLVLPPALAPLHLVIVPIFKTSEDLEEIKEFLKPLINKLNGTYVRFSSKYAEMKKKLIRKMDDDTQKTPWWKFHEREMKGVPLRVTIWKRDLEAGKLEVFNRSTWEKTQMTIAELSDKLEFMLLDIQKSLLHKNKSFREEHTYYVDSYEEFKEKIEQWFVFAHRDWTSETAEKIQEDCKATIRCFPNEEYVRDLNEKWVDMISWKESVWRVLFAKSY